MIDLTPTRKYHFAFGLWTVGHPGHDPFGVATRPKIAPEEIVRRPSDLGVWGVNFHDDDLLAEAAQSLRDERPDLDKLASRGYHNDLLDQRLIEVLLGVA